ncbi:MAG: hypothetical protein ACM359_21425 [Bacillota bacterium]
MDLSKLPRLSQTDQPAPSPTEPQPAEPIQAAPLAVGAEAWFSIALGFLLLLLQQNFLVWLKSTLFGGPGPAPFIDGTGRTFTYAQSDFFLHDLGLAAFSIALLLDGVLLLASRKPVLIAVGLSAAALAAAWNLLTIVLAYSKGYGLQLMPALAVLFGVYMVFYQWNMLTRSLAYRK